MALELHALFRHLTPPFWIVQDEKGVQYVSRRMGSYAALIGRSCPPTPEHGYFESVVLRGEEHLREMLRTTQALHPRSEVLVMPFITPLLGSFVWTPTSAALGPGNDGATAGKESVRVPLVPTQLDKLLLDAAGIPEGATPFVEGLVGDGRNVLLVQLRHGPAVPATLDYVPETMRVRQVIKAEGDLMKFAEKVKNLPEGTVVEHVGGSLVSHYGVHCMNNKVAIMTTRAPQVGETLAATPKWAPEQKPEQVAEWMLFALRDAVSRRWDGHQRKNACDAALFIIHNAAAMGDRPELLGAAIAILAKLCTIACLGEARHSYLDEHHGVSRLDVFRRGLRRSLAAFAKLPEKRDLFERMGTHALSIGGQAWAQCTTVTIDLIECMREFAAAPNAETLGAVLGALNVAINEAHNGGWWLNKFTDVCVFTACSHGYPHAVGYAFPGLLGIMRSCREVTPKVRKRVAERRKQDFLKQERMERRGVVLREPTGGLPWYVDPRRGMMVTTGTRWSYEFEAPKEIVEEVRSGRMQPLGTSKGPEEYKEIKKGAMLRFTPVREMHEVWSRVQSALTIPVGDVRVVGSKHSNVMHYKWVSEWLRERVQLPSSPLLLTCTKCSQVAEAPAEQQGGFVCGRCDPSAAAVRERCSCGAEAVVKTSVNRQQCIMCLWADMQEEWDLGIREEQGSPVKYTFVMCAAPQCNDVTTLFPDQEVSEKFTCGCTEQLNLHKGAMAMTLERLARINEQETQTQEGERNEW
jgi:hypothetical protein